jgi:translocation-and-assembly-module (TAM) inner membrane subunit TamB-like protein
LTDNERNPSSSNEPQAASEGASAPASRPKRKRGRWHTIRRALAIVLAVAAALVVTFVSIDLGVEMRRLAERGASAYLDRPTHIGKLRIRLLTGEFEVDNLVIEGLKPSDRPFMTAKRVFVNMPWWTFITHQLVIENIDMDGWDMLVEQFPNGKHNFPRVKGPPRAKPKGPSRWPLTTTARQVNAKNGRFIYDDHTTPWRVVCPNLNVSVWKGVDTYHGTAAFSGGRVRLQSYEEFAAALQTRFRIDNGKVLLDEIRIDSTGAATRGSGDVDLGNWPDMLFNVRSRVDFPIQKGIFFRTMDFTVAGTGDFTGAFRFFKTPAGSTGYELKGNFTTPQAGVDAWRFSNVRGALLWNKNTFRVTNVTTDLYGGAAKFDYTIEPLGQPARTPTDTWNATYTNIDLAHLSDFLELQGIRPSGRATGFNKLEWPSGHFKDKKGSGEITATMPDGLQPMSRQLRGDLIAKVDPLPPLLGPFNPGFYLGYVPIAGHIAYSLDPEWIHIASGWAASEKTYVEFSGQTAWAQRSTMPFHVTSLDWEESDRLLAGIMTAFGSKTGAIDIGGHGQFDGTMLGAFGNPRIEGHFDGDRMRAFNVVWGRGTGDLVIENSYVDVTNGVIQDKDSRIDAEGRFSLGYPRKDHGEEINAVIKVSKRPVVDLRQAFQLQDYRIDGLLSGEFHMYGAYLTPDGVGRMQVDHGNVYGETFETATSDLRFERTGLRLDAVQIAKNKGPDGAVLGKVTGAAWVAWDGTYTFDADGTKIPIESMQTLQFKQAPLSGILQFTASGAGAFASPRYDVKVSIADLYAGDEGIGDVKGTLSLRGDMLTITDFEASSKRLSVSGSLQLGLTPEMDVNATLQFSDTSIDPYLRFVLPQSSPFNSIVADGKITAHGELADIDHLVVEADVDRLQLKLFDYAASNDGPIQLVLNNHVVEVKSLRLKGEDTALELSGTIGLHTNQIALDASGDANLGILQAFYYRSIRSEGSATLRAQVRGSLDNPVFSGNATITGGRIRFQSFQSLQGINARLLFDPQGIRIVDASAQLGGGSVTIGGRIGLKGFAIGNVDLSATGEQMRLRYPEGFRSNTDVSLTLRGNPQSLLLAGSVKINDGVYEKAFQPNVDIISLVSGAGAPAVPPEAVELSQVPVRLDIKIAAPGTIRLDNSLARITARADLTLGGTFDHPTLSGTVDIDRGEVFFEGNRYRITRGTLEFYNPTSMQPFFDIEAETRINVPGASEPFRVALGVSGSLAGRLNMNLNSDPPLPNASILALVFGQANADIANPEIAALSPQTATQNEELLLREGIVRVLIGGLTGSVGTAVERAIGIDTVQISPNIGTSSADPLTPSARLILGTRLSDRAFLTFSRDLSAASRGGDQVIVLEYDQSDRVSWVLTQTGSTTFAIDFRFRRTF